MNKTEKIDAIIKLFTFNERQKTVASCNINEIIAESLVIGLGIEGQRLSCIRGCGSYQSQSAIQISPVRKTNGALVILVPGTDCPRNNLSSELILYVNPAPHDIRRFAIAAGANIGYVIDSTVVTPESQGGELPIEIIIGASTKEIYKL